MISAEDERQFIMTSFGELDSPEFMQLALPPEYSTYLTLRTHPALPVEAQPQPPAVVYQRLSVLRAVAQSDRAAHNAQ